ncbi:MAG: hypothetical protein EPO35_13190 [Acidobacteria bacterium]|nr:MAG: hypothetical protein EPO35_13190 [Acidobacteriota bacterium]
MPDITRRLVESGSRDWKVAKGIAIVVRLEGLAMGMSPQSPAFEYAAKSSAARCIDLAKRIGMLGDLNEIGEQISYRAGAAWKEVQPIARRKRRTEGIVTLAVVAAGIYLVVTQGTAWPGIVGAVLALAAPVGWHLRWPR